MDLQPAPRRRGCPALVRQGHPQPSEAHRGFPDSPQAARGSDGLAEAEGRRERGYEVLSPTLPWGAYRQDIPADISPQKPHCVVGSAKRLRWRGSRACGSRRNTNSAAATKSVADNTMIGSLVRMAPAVSQNEKPRPMGIKGRGQSGIRRFASNALDER
jgi:hypothetical protein